MSHPAVCSVVVTYQPDDYCLSCIKAISQVADHLIVVDNASTSDQIASIIAAIDDDKAKIIKNNDNVGLASALNQGVIAAAKLGYQWILLFDQDTIPNHDIVEKLFDIRGRYLEDERRPLGLIGCDYNFSAAALEGGEGAMRHQEISSNGRWDESRLIITSGTLINYELFCKIGRFADDFFIDHVDHEYCFRAASFGYVNIKSSCPLICQRMGNTKYRKAWINGKIHRTSNYSALRRYYQSRNMMRIRSKYKKQFPLEVSKLSRHLLNEFIRVIRFEDHKLIKLYLILFGIAHGVKEARDLKF